MDISVHLRTALKRARVLRIVLLASGTIVAPAFVTIARLFSNDLGVWAVVVTVVAVIASVSIGLLLLFTSTDAADLVDDVISSQDRAREAVAKARKLEMAARRAGMQHALVQTLGQIVLESSPTLSKAELVRDLELQLEALVEFRKDLFGVTPKEKWNFCVYGFSPTRKRLECLALRRGWTESRDHIPRAWESGKGHVGQAYAGKGEFVYPDCNEPSVKRILETTGGTGGKNDKNYISVAALSMLDGGEGPMGVVVATSNTRGRFDPDRDADLEPLRDWARMSGNLISRLSETW